MKIRLFPSKLRIWLGTIACGLLLALGVWMVHSGHAYGWLIIVLFGFGAFAPGLLLIPGASWLELDEGGFTLCLSFKRDRYLWTHIREMTVWRGVVSFKLYPESRGGRRGQAAARAISGYDGSIPNMFRPHPQSLLESMMEFKQNNEMHGSGGGRAF